MDNQDVQKIRRTISLPEAQKLAVKSGKAVSIPTLISWIVINNLGFQPAGKGGKWYIFKDDFIKFITGEQYAKSKGNNSISKTGSSKKSESSP
jgi:hypothetical protein